MSTKLTLKEKLAKVKVNAENKANKTEIKSDVVALTPAVPIPEQFTVATSSSRIQKQRMSRKKNPKEIIISNPHLNPTTENMPRLLTTAELDFLLEGIPIPKKIRPQLLSPLLAVNPNRPRINYSSDPDISYLIYVEIREYFKMLLSEIKLTPSALTDYRTYMTTQFFLSRGIPGTSVGIGAADAISAPITQSTLNSFHSSGTSKSISYGIEYLEELINASKVRKQTTNTIHFKNKFLGFERVLEYRRKLVQLNLENLVKDYDILPATELSRDYWYPDYLAIYKTEISRSGLRLYLNPQLMFDYRVGITEIRNALIQEKPGLITVVIAPTYENIVDIYPIEAAIGQVFKSTYKDKEVEVTSEIFLQNLMLPLLSKIKVKGINKITNLFPVSVPIWAGIKSTQMMGDGIWNCIYDPKVLTINNLKVDRIKALLQFLNFTILEEYETQIVIKMPSDYKNILPGKTLGPNEYILGKIEAEKERADEEYEMTLIYPYSELLDLAYYWIAETNGSNLEALFAIRELDHDVLTTNDVHEAKEIFGIEGAKHILLKEFIDALDSLGSGTDPRHLVLMTDFMTNKGLYLGFTNTGVEAQETSGYEQAAFERANEKLFNTAVFGERLPVSSVTPSVFVGADANFGTNYNKIVPKESEQKTNLQIANSITQLSVTDAENALDVYDDSTSFTFSNPSIEIPGNANIDFDPSIRSLLAQKSASTLNAPFIKNPANSSIGLPPSNSNLNVNINPNPTIGLPTRYNGKVESIPKFNPTPIRSELLTNSVGRISGIPRLDNPQPIHLPISTDHFYENNLPIQMKSAIKAETPAKVIGIPRPGTFDAIPVSNLTNSGVSAVPIIKGIPKLQLKGIPPLKVSLPSSNTAKPIDINDFLNS
jgi:hypothetical protein